LATQSQVAADIQAMNVTVRGRFKGDLVVRSRAELAGGGRVDGNVSSKTLVVAEGAVFSGQSIMGEQASQVQPQRAGTSQPTAEAASGDGPPSIQIVEAEKARSR